jgi:hypothetical protein
VVGIVAFVGSRPRRFFTELSSFHAVRKTSDATCSKNGDTTNYTNGSVMSFTALQFTMRCLCCRLFEVARSETAALDYFMRS